MAEIRTWFDNEEQCSFHNLCTSQGAEGPVWGVAEKCLKHWQYWAEFLPVTQKSGRQYLGTVEVTTEQGRCSSVVTRKQQGSTVVCCCAFFSMPFSSCCFHPLMVDRHLSFFHLHFIKQILFFSVPKTSVSHSLSVVCPQQRDIPVEILFHLSASNTVALAKCAWPALTLRASHLIYLSLGFIWWVRADAYLISIAAWPSE